MRFRSRRQFLIALGGVGATSILSSRTFAEPPTIKPPAKKIELFDGQTLKGWKVADFAGQGEVRVADGRIEIDTGENLSGIVTTRAAELPRMNYELSLEAMRVDGGDFFCGLTFPVGKDACSLIVGGWGGAVVGLSSLDGQDASENETTQGMTFRSARWYRIRARVTSGKIECWIDDERVVNVDTADKKIGIRIEVEPCVPLGIAAWQTTAAWRKIQMTAL